MVFLRPVRLGWRCGVDQFFFRESDHCGECRIRAACSSGHVPHNNANGQRLFDCFAETQLTSGRRFGSAQRGDIAQGAGEVVEEFGLGVGQHFRATLQHAQRTVG